MSWAWLSTETSSRSARASSPCQHLPSRHPAKMTALPGKRAEVGSPVLAVWSPYAWALRKLLEPASLETWCVCGDRWPAGLWSAT